MSRTYKRLITFELDDKEHCPKGCPLYNTSGCDDYCSTEVLDHDEQGNALRTKSCVAEAYDVNGTL